jgi:small subunit ribosomal protein S6
MNQYETVFILNPVLSDEQIRETVDKFTGYLESQGAKIINREHWACASLPIPFKIKRVGFTTSLSLPCPERPLTTMK